jgi:hypothetical protein
MTTEGVRGVCEEECRARRERDRRRQSENVALVHGRLPFSLGAFDDAAKSEWCKSGVTANTRKASSIGKMEDEKFVEKSRSSRLLRAQTFAMSSTSSDHSNAIARAMSRLPQNTKLANSRTLAPGIGTSSFL